MAAVVPPCLGAGGRGGHAARGCRRRAMIRGCPTPSCSSSPTRASSCWWARPAPARPRSPRASSRRDEVLSSDAFRERIAGDPADQSATGAAFAALHRSLRLRLARRELTVVDATSVGRRDRQPLVRAAQAAGVPCVAVVLDLPHELVVARNAGRQEGAVPEAVVRRHLGRLAALDAPAGAGARGLRPRVRPPRPGRGGPGGGGPRRGSASAGRRPLGRGPDPDQRDRHHGQHDPHEVAARDALAQERDGQQHRRHRVERREDGRDGQRARPGRPR